MLASRLRGLQRIQSSSKTIIRLMGGGGAGGHHAGHGDDHHDDHHHDHGPLMPPFGRSPPPTSSLPLEVELVWDDTVAPETAIDFDAPQIPTGEVIFSFLTGIGFFGLLYAIIAWSEPEKRSPVASRAAVLSKAGYLRDLGISSDDEEEGEEEHNDEDEE